MCKRKALHTLPDRRRDQFTPGKPLGASINTTDRSTPYQGLQKFKHFHPPESSRRASSHASAPAGLVNGRAFAMRAALAASGSDRRLCRSSIRPGLPIAISCLLQKVSGREEELVVQVSVMFYSRETFCSERGSDPRMLPTGRKCQ